MTPQAVVKSNEDQISEIDVSIAGHRRQIDSLLERRASLLPADPGEADFAAQVMKIINQNYKDPNISINFITERVRSTPTYVSTVINKVLGKSLRTIINERRVETAKDLLALTTKSIKQIAYETGFADPHYFCRVFVKFAGVTTTNYREQIRGKKELGVSDGN